MILHDNRPNTFSNNILDEIPKVKNSITGFFNIIYDKSSYYINKLGNHTYVVERHFPKLSYIEQYESFFRYPTYIMDGIYLGSSFNASNYDILKELNIGLVINITTEISCYFPQYFEYKKYHIEDNNIDSIKDILNSTFIDIKTFKRKSNKNILIHCFMGASRSAAAVIHYICKTENILLDEAINIVKDKRPVINLSKQYIKDLYEMNQMYIY